MAGVEKIKEKILQDSEAKANAIIADAKKQAQEIIDNANVKAAKKAEEIKKKASSDAADKLRISNSMLELEMRKDILSTKQQLIEETFKKALESLSHMNDGEYEAMLQSLVIKAVETGEEEILLSKQDKNRLSADFSNKINLNLAQIGKKGNLKFSDEARNIIGGFVLKSGGVEMNYSFEALLRMYRDEIEPEVAAILF
ncbi:MAG: H+transporting two-sector ATPase subunit [Clostridia bacterium]|jgi:V/A-type H+-transporting ATPase subunit E|nr:H+transporting two-sector ATPase subunit [Clostridia bacterium]